MSLFPIRNKQLYIPPKTPAISGRELIKLVNLIPAPWRVEMSCDTISTLLGLTVFQLIWVTRYAGIYSLFKTLGFLNTEKMVPNRVVTLLVIWAELLINKDSFWLSIFFFSVREGAIEKSYFISTFCGLGENSDWQNIQDFMHLEFLWDYCDLKENVHNLHNFRGKSFIFT